VVHAWPTRSFDFFADTIDETAKVAPIGAVREVDIHDECSSLMPAEGPRSS
jgi:hypothetical protein